MRACACDPPRSKTDIVFYADIWLFHTDTNRWEQVTPVGSETPCKRYGHSIAQVENLIYLYGGFVTEGLASSRLNDMWELNPGTPTSSSPAPNSFPWVHRSEHCVCTDLSRTHAHARTGLCTQKAGAGARFRRRVRRRPSS